MPGTVTANLDEHRARRDIPKVARILLGVTGRTARELGEVSGLTESQMSDRLSGRTRIGAVEVAAWADFLGVDPGLFYRQPDELRALVTGRAVAAGSGSITDATGLLLSFPGRRPASKPDQSLPAAAA